MLFRSVSQSRYRVLLFEPLDWIFGVETDEFNRLKNPLSRFLRLMHQERGEVILLYVYALFTGIIALSLPLGIQAIIGFLMGAQVSTSLVLLIVLVLRERRARMRAEAKRSRERSRKAKRSRATKKEMAEAKRRRAKIKAGRKNWAVEGD